VRAPPLVIEEFNLEVTCGSGVAKEQHWGPGFDGGCRDDIPKGVVPRNNTSGCAGRPTSR
jgi:hypothetical protein